MRVLRRRISSADICSTKPYPRPISHPPQTHRLSSRGQHPSLAAIQSLNLKYQISGLFRNIICLKTHLLYVPRYFSESDVDSSIVIIILYDHYVVMLMLNSKSAKVTLSTMELYCTIFRKVELLNSIYYSRVYNITIINSPI